MTLGIFEKKINSVSHITHDEIFLPENLRNVYVDITQSGKILVSGNTIQKNGQEDEYKYVVYLLNEHLDIEDTFEILTRNYELKDFVFEDSKFGAAEYTAMFTDQRGSYFYQSYDENFILISEPKSLNQQLVDQYISPQVNALDIDWNYSDEIVILHVHNVQGEYGFNAIESDLVYYLDYNKKSKIYYLVIEEMNNKEDKNILLSREMVSLDSLDYVYWGIAKDDFSEPSHLVLFDAFGDNPNSSDIYDFGSADEFLLNKVTGSVFDEIGQIRNYSIAETENDEAVVAYSSWDGHNTLIEKSSFEYVNADLTLKPLLVGQRIWADLRSFELENVKGILWQSSNDEGMTWEEVYYTFAGGNFDQSYYVSKKDLNSIIRYTVDLYSSEDVVSLNSGMVLIENYVPEIISEAVTAAKEDIVYNYDILTSDLDVNDIVEISVKTKPDWLSFDESTGVLSGTPTNDEVGDHLVVLRATDGAGAYAEQSFTVSVSNVNDDPVVTSSAVTSADEDASYSYTFVASDIDVGDTVILSAETKPDWLSFDESTGVLSGTPTNDEVGDHLVVLRATDAAGSYDEQSFVLSVVNIPPEGQLWDKYRSRANLLDDELTIELLSDYSPTADDPFSSAVSIPGNAILDLRNKSFVISDIPIVIPAVIPPMYVNVPEEIVNLADHKDVLIGITYNDFVFEQQLILTVDGIAVKFTPDQINYQESPIVQPGPNEEHVNITITSDFIDESFAKSAIVIELGHKNSALVRLTKLDTDNYLVTKVYTGDYSQTLSKESFMDAEYDALTYVGDDWTDSVVIGTDSADTIKSSNQNTAFYAGAGNDTIILEGNGTFDSGFVAFNISSSLQTGTEERISLNVKTRFEDVVDGGADVDTVILTDASDAFFLHDSFSDFHSSLTLSDDYSGNSGTTRIENIENINAGGGDDIVDLTSTDYSLDVQNITVNGGEGSDTLWGSDADETLIGGTDNDVLFGGAGVNELIGGSGADEFQFTKTSTHDTIDDFSISDGDTLKFFNTGGAQFDRVSIALNLEGDELFIAYGSGLNDMLTISLPNAGLHLDELTSDVLIIV